MNEPTPTKPIWQSKTFWAALLTALIGAYRVMAPNYGWDTGWIEGAVIILAGLGLWGIRMADTTLTTTRPTPDAPANVLPGPAADTVPPRSDDLTDIR